MTLSMAFVELEKAFNRVPSRVIWWALLKLGIDEWLVRPTQSMYENTRSRLCVGCNLKEEFSVKVDINQASCLRHYCSPRFWKPSPKSFIQDVHRETCKEMTWSLSLNRCRNYNRRWSSGRPTWNEKDFRSTWAKPKSLYLDWGSLCFRILTKTSGAWVPRVSAKMPYSLVVVSVGSTRNAVAYWAVWSLMPTSGVNGALDRSDQ